MRPVSDIDAEIAATKARLAALRAERKERAGSGNTRRLPPMTDEEYRLYYKLRYRNLMPRDVALAEVLP